MSAEHWPPLHNKSTLINLRKLVEFNNLITFIYVSVDKSSVIRQKGESQNGCFKKAKQAKISEKQTFITS